MDTELRAAVDDKALTARIDRLDQSARRALADIENTDPDRSMFPLRTGAASGRRVLSAARSLLNGACG